MPRDNPTVTQRLLGLEEAFINHCSPNFWVSSANPEEVKIHCGDNTLHYHPLDAADINCFFISNEVRGRSVKVEMWDYYLNDPRISSDEWETAVEVGMKKMEEHMDFSVCDADAYT